MKSDKMILGEDAVYSMDSNSTGVNNNIIVVGPTGGGKTLSIGEANFLTAEHSSQIITCTKRRLVHKYLPYYEKKGFKVYDLNFVEPEKSTVAYDPLHYIFSYTDISFLAESIVMANSRKESTRADPYWDMAATSLMCALITYCIMFKKDDTFADVLELFDELTLSDDGGTIRTSLDDKFNYMERRHPNSYAISCWRTFRQTPIKTAGCIYSTLSATLDTIFTEGLRKMMRMKNKVDFRKLASEKSVLFVTTSPVNPALHRFVNTFYGTAFKQLFEFAESQPDGKLPIPVRVFCDDFAVGGRITNFPELISIFREKRISVTILLQSESQLDAMYGVADATSIVNNCDTYIFMGTNDLKTAQSMSLRLNVPLDEILYMPLGQEVIFRRGQRPIITRRYDIMQDRLYKKVTKEYEKTLASQSGLPHNPISCSEDPVKS